MIVDVTDDGRHDAPRLQLPFHPAWTAPIATRDHQRRPAGLVDGHPAGTQLELEADTYAVGALTATATPATWCRSSSGWIPVNVLAAGTDNGAILSIIFCSLRHDRRCSKRRCGALGAAVERVVMEISHDRNRSRTTPYEASTDPAAGLVQEALVPPADLRGRSEQDIEECRTEYNVLSTLSNLGHEVQTLGIGDQIGELRRVIREWQPEIAFNLLEEFSGIGSYDHYVVALLELIARALHPGRVAGRDCPHPDGRGPPGGSERGAVRVRPDPGHGPHRRERRRRRRRRGHRGAPRRREDRARWRASGGGAYRRSAGGGVPALCRGSESATERLLDLRFNQLSLRTTAPSRGTWSA